MNFADARVCLSATGALLEVDESLGSLTGFERAGLLGHSLLSLTPAAFQNRVRTGLSTLLETGHATWEQLLERAHGGSVLVQVKAVRTEAQALWAVIHPVHQPAAFIPFHVTGTAIRLECQVDPRDVVELTRRWAALAPLAGRDVEDEFEGEPGRWWRLRAKAQGDAPALWAGVFEDVTADKTHEAELQLARRLAEVRIDIAAELSSTGPLEQRLSTALGQLVAIPEFGAHAQAGVFQRLDDGRFSLVALRGASADASVCSQVDSGCLCALAIETSRKQVATGTHRCLKRASTQSAQVSVPLLVDGQVGGVLFVFCDLPHEHLVDLLRSVGITMSWALAMERRAQSLLAARDRAEASARAKSSFLAMMSHELRTPMNGVIGYAQLLLDEPMTERQREYVETIGRSSETLLALLNGVLEFSRLEAGPVPLEVGPMNVRDACAAAFELLAASAALKKVELALVIDPAVPSTIETDVGKLEQILVNLLGNAVKFTSAGFVALRVTADERVLRFAIEDTGIGIEPARLPTLFTAFTQADASIHRRFGGTGLGLAITRMLATTLGGDLTATSTPGVGSCFTLEFPRRAANKQEAMAPLRARVIVASRLAPVRESLGTLLQTLEVACDTVDSAAGLRERLATERYDAVFVDEQLTDAAGAAVAATLDPRLRLIGLGSVGQPPADESFDEVLWKPVVRRSAVSRVLGFETGPAVVQLTDEPLRCKVLVAEDNPVNRLLVKRILERAGASVEVATNGLEAVERCAAQAFDVVLMDAEMPVMDGLEATRRIKASGTPHQPIILALTANAFLEDRQRCLAAGMDDFLTKPIVPPVLITAVRQAAQRRSPQP